MDPQGPGTAGAKWRADSLSLCAYSHDYHFLPFYSPLIAEAAQRVKIDISNIIAGEHKYKIDV